MTRPNAGAQDPASDALAAALTLDAYPRSATYDPRWTLDNLMGPNALWLTEALSQAMTFEPGIRVLDMGCGKALSSIFLAKEFGVQVWATDLWIGASDNWRRIGDAGVQDRVFPLHAEAHALPFADGFFDALVSLDAYHYFGTDDLYFGQYARLARPGGQIGIVVPGLAAEFDSGVPAHLEPYWQADFWSFHSPRWWQEHWARTGLVEGVVADRVPNGWEHWLRWLEVCAAHGYRSNSQEAEMLRADAGRTLGFTRVVARRI